MTDIKFEDALARLEQIVDTLEAGNLPLEDSLKAFEEGVGLARRCARYLDEAHTGLSAAVRAHQRMLRHRVELATNALSSQHPLARISHGAAVLVQLRGRLVASATHRAKHSRHRLAAAVGRLQSLSPLAVLGRGYSLTRLASGVVVRSAAALRAGDAIEVLLAEGAVDARVTDVKERDDRHQV
jgi:exodeoxyribonuclease VII large subunit